MTPAAANRRRALGVLALAALAAFPAAGAGAGTLELESRVSAATGRYVYDRVTTDVWWSPGLVWVSGAWTWRAATPIVLRDTPLLTVAGDALVPTGGPVRDSLHDAGRGAGGRRTAIVTQGVVDPRWEWGVTEPTVRTDARWHHGAWAPALGAGVKVPGYNSDGFGTGEWDTWLSLGLGRDVAGDVSVAGTLSRAWWGDPPGLALDDTWSGVAELTRDTGTGSSVTLFGTFAESAVPGYADAWTAGLSLARRLERGDRLGLSVELGLVDVAPDFRASFTYNLKLAGD